MSITLSTMGDGDDVPVLSFRFIVIIVLLIVSPRITLPARLRFAAAAASWEVRQLWATLAIPPPLFVHIEEGTKSVLLHSGILQPRS